MIPFDTGLRFERLEHRLLEELRTRIANGEITERGLARQIEVSQPHMHNILKGVRALSPAIADRVLDEINFSVLDLATSAELWAALRSRAPANPGSLHVALNAGRISPQSPFPDLGEATDWVVLPADAVNGTKRPLLVEVDLDGPARTAFGVRDVALLDLDEGGRISVDPAEWYVVRLDGRGYVRQLRKDGGRLYLLGQRPLWEEDPGQEVSVEGSSLLQFVRARVVGMGSDPRRPYWGNCPAASS